MPGATQRKTRKRMKPYENGADQSESTSSKRKETAENDERSKRKDTAENDERIKICSGVLTRKTIPAISVTPLIGNNSQNLVHHMHNTSLGRRPQNTMRKSLCQPFVRILSNAKVYRTASPFDRRVTAIEWHPTHPTVLAIGSKGGDMILWDYERTDKQEFISGIGKGGSITSLKFNVDNLNTVYTSSVSGKISLQDFTGRQPKILYESSDWTRYWYCALDVSFTAGLVTVGDSVGNTILLSQEGKVLWKHKLHKQKVTHCEFNPQCDWLVATSSVDKTVKLWDVRMVKGTESALHVLNHDKPVNSVVGRYPDQNFPGYVANESRSIDVIDVNTGDIVCQIKDSKAPGLISRPNGAMLLVPVQT
uniref:DNA damage-binding protein 2 n=1 Tax=Saccoglossus kowalevskii TaxID=10224 RepID=A0ABM0LWW4_SACKO|nr:PREDICTED: DNA damage-binding protein 2-like [Saccoglossus kowalevskii]